LCDLGASSVVAHIVIQFQGGFVGQDALVELGQNFDGLVELARLDDIHDTNSPQTFTLSTASSSTEPAGRFLKITFPSSTDFYGRVTIYSLQVYGHKR
jgi:hypothetical protein